ncbi:hypothetical protein TG4357_02716 [Thalassovita gelatinovora]|uniref:NADH dehydrogenase subunit E n=1 Tax=Thalassovita gelatinovora TaxID=53501 RepID=A0A0P1FFJ4_THAGE|nr:DUF5333 domain-containing protein [Thalassovita gelatinovora]QIZ79839.1 DUF5333 domain-containing protein [Thalassovita gelatinovora]CUH66918.1 hypothetical protein TG4357_02716 [Thalassovita gelatinovora]SEQ45125.1 hypothetical protein SAMN04488043_105253 [Thalassovita gelatinovora]
MRMISTLTTAAVLTIGMGCAASAKAALRDVPKIDDNMLWVALALEISDQCDEIKPRTLKGLLFLNSLKKTAKAMGYSDAEINDYVKSDEEKARMRNRGEAYVKSMGLNPADTGDLCTLGHAEIARNSQIGVLLKAK